MNRVGIKLSRPRSPDIVIVDGQQLLYHVTWPCGGDPSGMVASMKSRLAPLPCECVLVFDRCDNVGSLSPKDHERMRRAGVGSTNCNIAINSPLGPRVEACTSRALPDYKSAILLPPSHKSKKMLPRKRDTSHSHTKGPFSGPALTIMSFNVDGLSSAKEQLIANDSSVLSYASRRRTEGQTSSAQHTKNGFGRREATVTICYVGHHREYNITNRHQQHRDPESRPKWNLSDVSLQTTR